MPTFFKQESKGLPMQYAHALAATMIMTRVHDDVPMCAAISSAQAWVRIQRQCQDLQREHAAPQMDLHL